MEAKNNNQVFMAILFFSALFHIWCFQRINNLYDPSEISVIEMSVEDISKPQGRDIPRPRFKPKMPPMDKEIAHQPVVPKLLPNIKPMQLEPAKVELPETPMEKITVPDNTNPPSLTSPDYHLGEHGAETGGVFGSSKDYYDMVRMRIESNKKYPGQAKAMHHEGRVTVRFTIYLSGETKNISVIKSSGYRRLDRAAIQAIRNSSPLPSMPKQFFSTPETVELTIVFELY